MDFRFNTITLFRSPIVKITNTLVPSGFIGDRRAALDATAKIAEILNDIGEASAKAQGLGKPVTSAQKLRNSDHTVYLLTEKSQKSGAAVTGLLKVGHKTLYIFDANGDTQMVNAPCLLDFYIHESRQRSGLGKVLFETMLQQENLLPDQLAIDRPSEKLIGFLKKHYGLKNTIPQMNNFVVFQGFFNKKMNGSKEEDRQLHLTSSPNTSLFGPQQAGETNRKYRTVDTSSKVPIIQSTPVGRYAAPRPTCSMAQIIHNGTMTTLPNEPQSRMMMSMNDYNDCSSVVTDTDEDGGGDTENDDEMSMADVKEVGVQHDVKQLIKGVDEIDLTAANPTENLVDGEKSKNMLIEQQQNHNHNNHHHPHHNDHYHHNQQQQQHHGGIKLERPTTLEQQISPGNSKYRLNKMHMGLKNISFNVGAAVSPTNKMEFYQEAPESFGVVKITQPIGMSPKSINDDNADAQSVISSIGSEKTHLTEQGFYDLKFYHSKLW